jgi:hypothetical protein
MLENVCQMLIKTATKRRKSFLQIQNMFCKLSKLCKEKQASAFFQLTVKE